MYNTPSASHVEHLVLPAANRSTSRLQLLDIFSNRSPNHGVLNLRTRLLQALHHTLSNFFSTTPRAAITMMMRLALLVTLAILALSNGFAPPAATQCRSRSALSMASVEERAKAKNVVNSTQKASRFRVDQSEEGKTAAGAFREPAPSKSGGGGGGGGLFGLFGGNKKNPVEKAASAVSGAVNGATQKVIACWILYFAMASATACCLMLCIDCIEHCSPFADTA
jgi:hypothetical protein